MPTATKKKPVAKPLVFGSPPPRTEEAQAADEYIHDVVRIWAKAIRDDVTDAEREALHDVVMHVLAEIGDKHAEALAEVRQELEAEESRNDEQERLIADLRAERNNISDELDEVTKERDDLKDALADVREALNRR